MLPMAFFLQDDHERVENDQEQLLDAIDELTFFLKRLNSQMNKKLLLGLEMAWDLDGQMWSAHELDRKGEMKGQDLFLMTACLGPHTAPPLSSNVHKLRLSFSCALRFPNTISGQPGTLSCQYGLWYGPPVRTTPYSCTSPRLPPWLIQTLLRSPMAVQDRTVRTGLCSRPNFALLPIFSQTSPKPSHDQSKSFLDLTSQDNYFRTLLKLD
ncbi:hypothetical protein YC2023_051036 [Brassica napus]